MTALSLVLIGFSTNTFMLLFAAFGYGAVQPMLQSLCMKSMPSELRGAASSTNFFMAASTLSGAMLCGFVVGTLG